MKDNYRAGAQECDCKLERLWVPFSLEEMNNLIFSFFGSGNGSIAEIGELECLNRAESAYATTCGKQCEAKNKSHIN